MSAWEVHAVCPTCGWYDDPLSGDPWFTRQRHPCCPECGEIGHYVIQTRRYVPGIGWEVRPPAPSEGEPPISLIMVILFMAAVVILIEAISSMGHP